jgi:hypothetical protein
MQSTSRARCPAGIVRVVAGSGLIVSLTLDLSSSLQSHLVGKIQGHTEESESQGGEMASSRLHG